MNTCEKRLVDRLTGGKEEEEEEEESKRVGLFINGKVKPVDKKRSVGNRSHEKNEVIWLEWIVDEEKNDIKLYGAKWAVKRKKR